MKTSGGGEEDTVVVGLFVGREAPSPAAGVNHMGLGSGDVGYDTQVETAARSMWI